MKIYNKVYHVFEFIHKVDVLIFVYVNININVYVFAAWIRGYFFNVQDD